MEQSKDLLEQLQQLLHHKKSNQYYANKLGITEDEVEELRIELKRKKLGVVETEKEIFEDLEEITKRVNIEKGTLESKLELTFDPQTVEELAKLHKIDLSKYKISNYWSKLKSNGKFTSSVFATLKKPKDYTTEDFTKFLENWKPKLTLIPSSERSYSSGLEEVDVELNIADFHLAKKTIQGDTLDSKEFDYCSVVAGLVTKVRNNYNIRKLVFPISNDFFHSDNYQNTTTNGTPQDVTAWFDEEYEKGFDILANTITYLEDQAQELEIILVQGNHDRTKGFFVAHALEIFFKNYSNIKFQRHHSVTKHTVLGNTFIGYHHGNSCKLEQLPLLFKTSKEAIDFGNAKFREIHTGDKHHYMAKEVMGVRIQQMPSLSGDDRWHIDHNFVNNIKAGLVLVYHPVYGKIAEFEHRI